jgi:hypothetical protein
VTVDERVAAFLAAAATSNGDALWMAAAGLLELAAARARESLGGRLHGYPAGELRRLEEHVDRAMQAARIAVALHQAEADDWHDATRDLRERAAESARAARRQQTMPATLARKAQREAERARQQ